MRKTFLLIFTILFLLAACGFDSPSLVLNATTTTTEDPIDLSPIFISIFVTACAYLFIPFCFVIGGKELEHKQIKKIVIINGICVWLVFQIIAIENGTQSVGVSVFLWSWIAHLMLKKKCLKKDTEKITNPPQTVSTEASPTEKFISLKNEIRTQDVTTPPVPSQSTSAAVPAAPPTYQPRTYQVKRRPKQNTILITDKTGASLQRTLTDDQLKAVKIILDQIPFGE